MKTVIMAGGKGTRISSMVSNIPKPMIRIGGKPILEHEIECLRDQGFTDIILTVGHLGHIIMDYFGDGNKISPTTGEPFGVQIEYYIEEEPLGNAGALFKIKEKLKDDFLLLNGDVMFDIDFNRFVHFYKSHDVLAAIFTHPNSHPYDSSLIVVDDNKTVQRWLEKDDEKPLYYKNRVNAGLHILSPELLEQKINGTNVDLDRQLLKPLAGTGKLICYDSPEYIKDMGTPGRYQAVSDDFRRGNITARNLRNKQKAVFLDRDGTINRYVGFLKNIDEFELLPGVPKAIRSMHDAGYLVFVVTNQPVIARGDITWEGLEIIHNKMETMLGQEGSYLDGIYVCPHHPHSGYDGEILELKIECGCRKPKPGMLFQAAEEYNIDLEKSWMVGDSENDIKAGIAAGCKTALLGCRKRFYGQKVTVQSLIEFVDIYLKCDE